MAHHGYIPLAHKFLTQVPTPRILEIGVDRGQTLIPMLFWLSHNKQNFNITSVDIRLDENLEVMLRYSGIFGSPYLDFFVENSLEFLKKDRGFKYDLVFLDGDHNYYTVSQELELLKSHVHPGTLIIIDDYDGRWSERDLFHSQRDAYKENTLATPIIETEKHGVKAAVDEFLQNNPQYTKAKPIPGEPVLIFMDPKNNADKEHQDKVG